MTTPLPELAIVSWIDTDTAPIGKLLGVTGRVMTNHMQRLLDGVGLTHAGWIVLARLEESDALTVRDISRACLVSPATMTGVIDTLEREGLVERRRDDVDRRVVRIALTPAGRRRVRRARNLVIAEAEELFSDVTPDDEAVVRQFLARTLNRLLQRQEQEATP